MQWTNNNQFILKKKKKKILLTCFYIFSSMFPHNDIYKFNMQEEARPEVEARAA